MGFVDAETLRWSTLIDLWWLSDVSLIFYSILPDFNKQVMHAQIYSVSSRKDFYIFCFDNETLNVLSLQVRSRTEFWNKAESLY